MMTMLKKVMIMTKVVTMMLEILTNTVVNFSCFMLFPRML